MKSSGRCVVGELLDSCGDPAPDGRPVVILAGREFVDAFGALLERLLAVALEHQGGGTPDIDLGYHGGKSLAVDKRLTPIIAFGANLRVKVAAWQRY